LGNDLDLRLLLVDVDPIRLFPCQVYLLFLVASITKEAFNNFECLCFDLIALLFDTAELC
jgi:hypothetical protein